MTVAVEGDAASGGDVVAAATLGIDAVVGAPAVEIPELLQPARAKPIIAKAMNAAILERATSASRRPSRRAADGFRATTTTKSMQAWCRRVSRPSSAPPCLCQLCSFESPQSREARGGELRFRREGA